MNNQIQQLYQRLRKKHGKPEGQWKLWCKRPLPAQAGKTIKEREEVIIGAILTQRTNWRNVEKAINNLKNQGLSDLKTIRLFVRIRPKEFLELIKPVGFYHQKTRYLLEIARFFVENGGVKKLLFRSISRLRKELLQLKGIGPETADSILLYTLDKPVFVIDEYTRRLAKREKLTNNLSYQHLQDLFTRDLPKDYSLFQDLHALIVIEGKE